MWRTPGDVLSRIAGYWDFSGPLPVPRKVKCPVCGSKDIMVRWWKTHVRPPHVKPTYGYRVDVAMKCCECAMLWTHGVIATESWWHKHAHQHNKTIFRKEGMERLGL